MFGMGWPEIAVILIVGMLLFGPDKLPGMARQAGRFLRTVRQMAENAKNDLGREMGTDLSGVDLDPRELVRHALMTDDENPPNVAAAAASTMASATAARQPRLAADALPPFDPDAT